MKKLCINSIFFTSLLFTVFVHAETARVKTQKVYIETSAITIDKGNIVIKTSEGFIKTKTLRSDSKGIYVLARDLPSAIKGISPPRAEYTCDGCYQMFGSAKARDKHEAKCPLMERLK